MRYRNAGKDNCICISKVTKFKANNNRQPDVVLQMPTVFA